MGSCHVRYRRGRPEPSPRIETAAEAGGLLAFADACRPLIAEDPDPARWAGAFLEARSAAARP